VGSYPVVAAGTRITSSLLNDLSPTFVFKTSNQQVASSIVPVNDTELVFPVVSGAQYEIEFYLRWSGLQAAGIRTMWSVPTGTSGNRDVGGPGSANAIQGDANTTEMRWAVHGVGTQVGMTNPRNSQGLQTWSLERAVLTIGGTSGNIQLQWAQFASNATASQVVAGSYAKYRRIG